MLDLFTIRV